MTAAARIRRLSLTSFRSYRAAVLVTSGNLVVLTGPNGAGKTNVLEAISLLSPGRGLRRAQLDEIAFTDGDVMLDPTTGHSLSESEMVEMLEPYVASAGESVSRALRMLLQPATRREIIARMLGNLKSTYLQTERWQRLLGVQQRLVILLPENIEEIRDRGFAYARLDYLRPALEDLERYLGDRPDADDATVVESQLHELRQRTQHNDRD